MASKIPKSSSLQYYKRQYYIVARNVRFRARFPGLSFCHTPNVRLPTFPHWLTKASNNTFKGFNQMICENNMAPFPVFRPKTLELLLTFLF